MRPTVVIESIRGMDRGLFRAASLVHGRLPEAEAGALSREVAA